MINQRPGMSKGTQVVGANFEVGGYFALLGTSARNTKIECLKEHFSH
jgi:hypothetical protein